MILESLSLGIHQVKTASLKRVVSGCPGQVHVQDKLIFLPASNLSFSLTRWANKSTKLRLVQGKQNLRADPPTPPPPPKGKLEFKFFQVLVSQMIVFLH